MKVLIQKQWIKNFLGYWRKLKVYIKTILHTSMNTVITFDGTAAPKNKCRRIKDNWYIVGDINVKDSGQCFKISNKYVRINSGLIAFDHEIGKYVRLKDQNNAIFIKGIVDVSDNQPVTGYYTVNYDKNVTVGHDSPFNGRGGNRQNCISAEVATKLGYIESVHDGVFYSAEVTKNNRPHTDVWYNCGQRLGYYEHFDLNLYEMEGNRYRDLLERYFNKNIKELRCSPSMKYLSKFLGKHSFGVEQEVGGGFLPERYCFKYGALPLKDGSLPPSGWEYAMLPYNGAKGLQALQEVYDVFKKYTRPDKFCSLHIHVGNNRHDKLYVIALYMLCYHLQHEIAELVPPFKKDARYFVEKKNAMDHCKYLNSLGLMDNCIFDVNSSEQLCANVSEYYNRIFTFLNEGVPPGKKFNRKNRIHKSTGKQKWNWHNRYYWVNFLPLEFKPSKTIEFRLHQSTVNKYKVFTWLFICIGLVRFADRYTKQIINCDEKYRLSDIMEEYATNFGTMKETKQSRFLANYLKDYIASRKMKFNHMMNIGEMYGDEFRKDHVYSFRVSRKDLFNFVRKT